MTAAKDDFLELKELIERVTRLDPEAPRLTPKSFAMTVAQAWVIHLKERMQHCNICGGSVDLSNATKPTAHVGRGG